MINMHWLLLVILIILKGGVVDGYCKKSLETLEIVDTCPSTKSDWDSAAMRKNCEFHANNQTCSDPVKFKYHCVSNLFKNETMDVCAPEKIIIGYCPGFTIQGATIQMNPYLPCTTFLKPCPQIYKSTDSYLYPDCYPDKLSADSTTRHYLNVTNTKNSPPKTESKSNKLGVVLGVIFPVLVVIVITGLVFYIRERRQSNTRNARGTDLGGTDIKLLSQISETGEKESLISKSSKIESLPSKDISISTATDRHIYGAKKTPEDLSKENIADTEKYMKTYETLNKYFVETRMYKRAKDCLNMNSVVIITGPPGCGKTNAAVHLMFQPTYRGWTYRKIRSFKEFAYLDFDKKSLVFIDNIFSDNMYSFDLENWWNEFDMIFDTSIRGKKDSLSRIGHDLHLIITARENIIEKACSFMKRVTPVFNEKCIINESEFELSKKEKDNILSKQEEFAVLERHMRELEFEGGSEGREKIKECKGPIGFPLCAHLFACNDEYRKIGIRFFSRPTEFLKIEIEEEIEDDKSNKTKTLFFVLFLHQCHLDKMHANIKLILRSEAQCKKFLNSLSTNYLQHFGPFDFRELPNIAKKLSGAFLLENEQEGVFTFLHDSVYEAVGVYFCERYFTEAVQFFPLEILQRQTYATLDDKRSRSLSLRLTYEIFNRKLSQVFTFAVFKRIEFVNCFCNDLKSRGDTFISKFFSVVDDDSCIKLPVTFWASRNRLSHLSSIMLEMLRAEGMDVDYHFYVSLYGICCSRNENLLTSTNGLLRNNLTEIKKRVLSFEDEDNNSILHIVILSDMSDADAAYVVQRLTEDGIDVNHRNKYSLTPLMIAVQQTSARSEVIEELLAQEQLKVKFKDANGRTVIHHCLMAKITDMVCANNLESLFQSKREDILKIINSDDNEGKTALNVAAKQTQFSRILSIILLLECEGIKTETIDCEGCSPIHNILKSFTDGCCTLALLERCVRVIIYIEYGVSPDIKNDEKKQAIDLTKNDDLKNILTNDKDRAIKETNLNNALRVVARQYEKRETMDAKIPSLSTKIPDPLKRCIQQAVQYLAEACLENTT